MQPHDVIATAVKETKRPRFPLLSLKKHLFSTVCFVKLWTFPFTCEFEVHSYFGINLNSIATM